ncbi:MAG: dTMP kinase [Holosporaceae bacterium]|jgi:dTMP kinase|nr:dTMP kinase [Holosporaceae bacterium]
MKQAGNFITFEGGEGAGKTTQVSLLAKKLSEDYGLKVHVTREPGGDEIGEKIRSVLKARHISGMDPICETLLMFAARRDHFVKLIAPQLEQGYFVICDRFYDSSLVYQGLLKHVSIVDILQLKQITLGNFEPDLTVILDVSAATSTARIATRHLIADEYDLMNQEKHEIVRKGFQKIAEIFSFRSVLLNAEGSTKIVFAKVLKAVHGKFPYLNRVHE